MPVSCGLCCLADPASWLCCLLLVFSGYSAFFCLGPWCGTWFLSGSEARGFVLGCETSLINRSSFFFRSMGLWVAESFRAFSTSSGEKGKDGPMFMARASWFRLLKLQSKSKYVFHPLELCTSLITIWLKPLRIFHVFEGCDSYSMVKTLRSVLCVRGL